jgi:hypothetical protein
VNRTTKDVDILGRIKREGKNLFVQKIERFPQWLEQAAKKVARDFDLPENWLNLGPASQLESGLPDKFEKRLVKRRYGQYLTIYYISRLDQIHFKLYASVDRNDYHVQDLISLKPTKDEMLRAVKWVLTQDVSDTFRSLLTDFLKKHGYASIIEKI